MKNLIFTLTLLTSSLSFAANTFTAKVNEAFCGEMDPFIIGDVCIVNLTKEVSGKKIALVIDFDDFSTAYTDGDLDNKLIEVNADSLALVTDRDQIEVLRDFDSDYFYMFAQVNSFTIKELALEMQELIQAIGGEFSVNSLPEAYKAKKLPVAAMNGNFKNYLKELTRKKMELWKEFVLNSGEFDNRSLAEVRSIMANPKKELGVEYLLEVEEIIAIYKNGQLIGYFVEVSDHVQAAIYQDGAWIDMFLDSKQKMLKSIDQSA